MPVIRTQDKVQQLQPGDRLTVVATDPGALNDIPAWCRINGHRVVEVSRAEGEVLVEIEVGPSQPLDP